MKKRILSMLLAILMGVSLLSGMSIAALAADSIDGGSTQSYPVYVGGEQFSSDKLVINGKTGTATYDPVKQTITLENYSYTGTGDYYNSSAIYSSDIDTLNVVLVGENTLFNTAYYDDDLNVGQGYGIRVAGNLNISGDGNLTITAKTTGIELTGALTVGSDLHITIKTHYGIYADTVEITGGKTEIYADVNGGNYGYSPYGIYTVSDMILSSGKLKVSAEYGYGIYACYDINLNSKFEIAAYGDALFAGDTLSITNAEGKLESTNEDAIQAKDDIMISDATLTVTAYDYGIYTSQKQAPVSIEDKSTVTITAAEGGIYTSKDKSKITISDSQVTITVDNGEFDSEEGICTEGEDSPIYIKEASTVNVTAQDVGIYTKDSSSDIQIGEYDSEDTSFVTVITNAENALETNGELEIGIGVKVVLTSSAADGNGIEYDDFEMNGGWLNNNGNHTFASDFKLDEALLIADEQSLIICENVSLTMNADLKNNGDIQNNGTLTIPNKSSLTGSGKAGGSGGFKIANFVDADIIVPENLEYSGEDQTEVTLAAISLPTTVTIQTAEFTYPNTDEWSLTIAPDEVKNAGTYTAVYTKSEKKLEKAFEVAKKKIKIDSAVVSDKVYDGSDAATVSNITFIDIIKGESLVFGEDYLVQSASFPDKDADCENQTVTMSVVLTDSALSSNYMLTNATFADENAAKITPKTLTITADSHAVYVGNRLPKLTFKVDGLIDGETLIADPTLSTNANMNKAGTYSITFESYANAGDNYDIIYVDGTLTVKNYPYIPSTLFTPTYPPVVDGVDNGDVTVSPAKPNKGDEVTIAPDPDEGYEADKVVVTDKNGKSVTVEDNSDGIYSFEQPTDEVTITVTFKEIAKDCPCDSTCPMYGYTDLDMTEWYHDGVHFCIENDLMTGTADDTFAPGTTLTRSMLVTILWRLEGEPVVNYLMNFEDVTEGQWYSEAIRWAASEGIVNGYGNGKFGTTDNITREQLATILYRYEQYKGGGFTGAWMIRMDYVDLAEVSDWAYEAMCWMNMNGIVGGKPGKVLDPKGSATRAEAATMLYRYCDVMTKEEEN